MKKYVFITPLIEGMGGAQMYLYSKYKTLSEQGWEVTLLHASRKPSILPVFRDFDNAIPELLFQINYYSKRRVKKVIDYIIKTYFTKKYEDIIISTITKILSYFMLNSKKKIWKDISSRQTQTQN